MNIGLDFEQVGLGLGLRYLENIHTPYQIDFKPKTMVKQYIIRHQQKTTKHKAFF